MVAKVKILLVFHLDLGDGQFSERCDVDGSFFNSDAIPIIFWKRGLWGLQGVYKGF